MRLNIGCGTKWLAGYLNVDIEPLTELLQKARQHGVQTEIAHGAEIMQYDLRQPWPWPDQSADEIVANEVLEHFDHWELHHILNEAHRVLKPEGTFTGTVPNFGAIWRHYENGADWSWAPEFATGPYARPCENALHNFCYGWGHKQVFTHMMLLQRFKTAGFDVQIDIAGYHSIKFTARVREV